MNDVRSAFKLGLSQHGQRAVPQVEAFRSEKACPGISNIHSGGRKSSASYPPQIKFGFTVLHRTATKQHYEK